MKRLGLGTTVLLLATSFFPLSWMFMLMIVIVCALICFFALKHRLALVAIGKETPRLILSKIISEIFVIMPAMVAVFLFIDVDYRWAFVAAGVLLILVQMGKVFYYLYARKNGGEAQ